MKAKTILNTSGALVTLGGAAVGSYYALNSKSPKPSLNSTKEQKSPKPKKRKPISEWLKSKTDKPMLDTNDARKDSLWENKWKKFQEWYEKNSNSNDYWKIYDWNNKKNSGNAYNEFKELCKSNSKKEIEDENNKLIEEVIMHCVEE